MLVLDALLGLLVVLMVQTCAKLLLLAHLQLLLGQRVPLLLYLLKLLQRLLKLVRLLLRIVPRSVDMIGIVLLVRWLHQ